MTMHLTIFQVMWLFQIFSLRNFVRATRICDNENNMKAICIAVRHEYLTKTSFHDVEAVDLKSKCKEDVPFISKTGDITIPPSVALCYLSEDHTKCVIDGDKEDEFFNLAFSNGICTWTSETQVESINEYLQRGESIIYGASATPIPPQEELTTRKICDDATSLKKICVGLRSDYTSKTSYDQANEVQINSNCIENARLVSETGYLIAYRSVALCYIGEFIKIICVIDSYSDGEFIPLSYQIIEGKDTCVWKSREKQLKSNKKYLKKGSAMLEPVKNGFFRSLLKIFTCGYFGN